MKNYYECLVDQSESSDESLFMKSVIGEDYDLLAIDSLLHEAFSSDGK